MSPSCTMCFAQTTSARRQSLRMRRQAPQPLTRKGQEKRAALCAPERWAVWARQRRLIPRTTRTRTGADFFAVMTTALLDPPAGSIGGLCDLLQPRQPAAAMPPQALPQRMPPPRRGVSASSLATGVARAAGAPLGAGPRGVADVLGAGLPRSEPAMGPARTMGRGVPRVRGECQPRHGAERGHLCPAASPTPPPHGDRGAGGGARPGRRHGLRPPGG